ncbi:hypothetical protein ANCCEY_00064 [Ancylostoma ceylanicum]|uniref:WAP domain-containing protein n=1 Tax=Ancylostoma ceylanicum TaxID=53326 RepID=A0A0D6MDL3_9BILA|nr:hypothetical protein ANCCEY_00064 [Ancylostoma ceylanicum]
MIVVLLGTFSMLIRTIQTQPPIPPPERPGTGVPCTPNNPTTCTGRNPFCASSSGGTFKCCSDRIQDSAEIEKLDQEHVKPVCPGGAIPFRLPQVMLCDPTIVNICPYEYTCVEAANGHLLPRDARSLCCKTSTLYSFASVFREVKLSPRIVPNPPLSAVEYVRLNVHTSATMHDPEIRTGDHFVLAPFKLLEPAYLKGIKIISAKLKNVLKLYIVLPDYSSTPKIQENFTDPLTPTESMQLYYDRSSEGGRYVDLTKPIPDGGFISKRIFNAAPMTNIENPQRPGPNRECMCTWDDNSYTFVLDTLPR